MIVYIDLLFTITINIENYYYKTINNRWLYQIILVTQIYTNAICFLWKIFKHMHERYIYINIFIRKLFICSIK